MNVVSNLNVEKLEKLTEETEFLMWGIEGNFHYINNRYLALRVDVEEMEENMDAWELAEHLERLFGRKATAGMTLVSQYGEVKEGKHHAKTLADKFTNDISKVEGTVTPFVYADGIWRYRWIKFEKYNMFVNDEFISFLYGPSDFVAYADGPDSPLFLCDGDFMILPIKRRDGNDFSKELEGFSEMVKSGEFAASAAIDPTAHT